MSGRSVLDIGCGSGAWLESARDMGWAVYGVEPDPVSRRAAADRGIDVRETLASFHDATANFDFITMNHVIEHLHDPVRTIRSCYDLLSPGGKLFIETPNLGAEGLRIYGRYWRGLEAPRHLILFHAAGLEHALREAGFHEITFYPQWHIAKPLSIYSERISRGALPSDECVNISNLRYGAKQRLRARFYPAQAEFITLTCRRPC